jgi:hypothetical protein
MQRRGAGVLACGLLPELLHLQEPSSSNKRMLYS